MQKESKSLGTMVIATSETTGRDAGADVVVRKRFRVIFY
jgi:hypothetical protein